MIDKDISAAGERAAIGGYLPQFSEFAWFAYRELTKGTLQWLKVADPEAEKLDDIQYATVSELHAYQVKWTIADATITFKSFKDLLPCIASSWMSLCKANIDKKVIPHLLTNKHLSNHDIIHLSDDETCSFSAFVTQCWLTLKLGQPVPAKFANIVEEVRQITSLSAEEFKDFILVFDFKPNHSQKDFSSENRSNSTQEDDLLMLRSFLLERVADPARQVALSRQEIVQRLKWHDRFKTVFNHELIVDQKKYQPIVATVEDLNEIINRTSGGFVFLLGGPGTGKSTLLTEWSRTVDDRVIKYYAFDFTNPSSTWNYYQRGDSAYLYFDLVFQLKNAGVYNREVLPYLDLVFLKGVFEEQLAYLGEEFKKSNKKTFIIIDGLDHVPREYKSVSQSFLRDLPKPANIPNGVYFILGSQSFDLDDLSIELKSLWNSGERSVVIQSLSLSDVKNYLKAFDFSPHLSADHTNLIYQKSQGHPLYLSYIVERLLVSYDRSASLDAFERIDGDIAEYYSRMWAPIRSDAGLVQLLGKFCRINGPIKHDFISEWKVNGQTLITFRDKAKLLFSKLLEEYIFFHNSFRQFLLEKTAIDPFTADYSKSMDVGYHKELAGHYEQSTVEPRWAGNFHLYKGGLLDEFIARTNPKHLSEDFINFRPSEDIRRDIKLGLQLAADTNNMGLFLRYLFAMAEIERRAFNLESYDISEGCFKLGLYSEIKTILRNGNSLNVSDSYALKAADRFWSCGNKGEANLLFRLATPSSIRDKEIVIEDIHNSREFFDLMDDYLQVAVELVPIEKNLTKIKNFRVEKVYPDRQHGHSVGESRLILLTKLVQILASKNMWDDIETVLPNFVSDDDSHLGYLFVALKDCVDEALECGERNRANEHLVKILSYFTDSKGSERRRIFVADIIYRVTSDAERVKPWLEGVSQPVINSSEDLSFDGQFDDFLPLIKYNKLLNLLGMGVSITEAVPDSTGENSIVVEFQRMICLITQVLCDGISSKTDYNAAKRLVPALRFFYRSPLVHNTYWYRISQMREEYYSFLAFSVAQHGQEQLSLLLTLLTSEFADNSKYWSASIRRGIITAIVENGGSHETASSLLKELEAGIFDESDVDGRISESIKQSRAYFLINNAELGKRWLKKAIRESIGIGYKKDYQFCTWIDWADKVNAVAPKDAEVNTHWFLSRLNYLRETTSGKAYWDASEKILNATLNKNIGAGLRQLEWQLTNGLVDYIDAIEGFIRASLKLCLTVETFDKLLNMYFQLLLPVSKSENRILLLELLNKAFHVAGVSEFKVYVREIYNAINIAALEEKRFGLIMTIGSFIEQKNLAITDCIPNYTLPQNLKDDTQEERLNELILSDGTRLDEIAVMSSIHTFEDLASFLNAEDKESSYFDWTNLLATTSVLNSREQLTKLADVNEGRRNVDIFATLSKKALDLGDSTLAKNLAEHSVKCSGRSGWLRYYDGGSRIKAFSALKYVDQNYGTSKAFAVFTNDVILSNSSSSYIESLDEIMPIISNNYDVMDVWKELKPYLDKLLPVEEQKIQLPNLKYTDIRVDQALTSLLIFLTRYPAGIICWQARVLIAKAIAKGDLVGIEQCNAYKLDVDADAEIFISILSIVRNLDVHSLIPFHSRIKHLTKSDNFQIRYYAIELLTSLGEEYVPKSRNLPKIYELEVPEIHPPIAPDNIDKSGFVKNTSNIRSLIKPFGSDIKILSRETDVDETILLNRVYTYMLKIAHPDTWSSEYEMEVRYKLDQADVKYAYTRPRVETARRAIMYVVTELVDAGLVALSKAALIFRDFDFSIFTIPIVKKPLFVSNIREKKYSHVNDEWYTEGHKSPRLVEPLIKMDNRYVIGEYSLKCSLHWGVASEKFMMQIAMDADFGTDQYIFGSAFNRLAEQYHDFRISDPEIIIVRDHRFLPISEMKTSFIAINPVLARYLNWTCESGKLFAWKNEQGETMVESVFWQSGNVNMPPPQLYSEASEGWLVIASAKALQLIQDANPQLFIQRRVERSKRGDHELSENIVDKISPLIL